MQTLSFNPTYASAGTAAAGGMFCKLFPAAARCQTITAPCSGETEPCGLTISGAQRCCPSGAQAPGPSRKYSLPSGKTGRVRAHRSFRTPSGRLTFNPNVATVTTRYVTRWAPAYHGRAAIGSRGAWVELPRNETSVGALHSPGLKARAVKVLAVQDEHALVRYRADAAPNPAYRSVVSTRRRRNRRAVVKVKAPGTSTASFDWCKWFPNSNKCNMQLQAACPAGTEWNGYHCAPSGNPASGVITSPRRQSGVILKNPVSAAEHRRQASGGGFTKLRQALRDLGTGRAKLVVGRQGIDVRAA